MSRNLTSSFPQFNLEMTNSTEHSVYVFDDFRLDKDRLMLYRGETEINLPPKAIKTLAILVENRGEIVSKDELIEAVWKDAFVEDSNLSHYLYLLRKALGTRSDGKPYIETLRKRGYRFDPKNLSLERTTNGAAANPAVSNGRSLQVERRGNVLALVDWKDPETIPVVADAKPEAAAKERFVSRSYAGLIVFVSLGLFVAVAAVLYLSRSAALVQEERAVEQNVLRLTNGIEVVDATISRDGKYFVYTEPEGKFYKMWVQQTGQSTRHDIVPASARLPLAKTFTPDGQHVYFVAVDAVGEPFSLYRVPTHGGPVTKILSGLGSGVSFSPDGRQMVFYRQDNDGAKYVIKASDGSGEETLLYNTTPGFGSAAWSLDGKLIAIVLQAKQEGLEEGCSVAVVDRETSGLIAFSEEVWDICGRMEWTSDSRGIYMVGTRLHESMTTRRDQIYYISYPQGKSRRITTDGSRHQWSSLGVTDDGAVLAAPFNRSSQIWVMDPNGESRSAGQITTGQTDGRAGIAPLADGRVAYISRTGENLNLWVMNQDGSDQKQLTDNRYPIEEVRSGGDGRFLVFASYVDHSRPHLFRINMDGTALKQLTSGDSREVDSSLSNDGKWIVYDSTKVFGARYEFSLWKQSLESGERVSLNRTDCQMPHFSPDDKYISCVRAQTDVLILSALDGTLIRTIRVPMSSTVSSTLSFGARWTPDGKSVAYIVNDKGVSNIWTHPIDGEEPKQLTEFTGGSIYHFAYSLDGKRLFVARGHQIRDAILIREVIQ